MRDTLFIALFPVSRRIRARLGQGADNIGVLSGIVNGMETGKGTLSTCFFLPKISIVPPDQQGSRWIFRGFRREVMCFNMIKCTAIMLIQRVILKFIPFAFDQ
ncbi:MAG: hypothetical protein V2I53_00895, partial [Paracoccaceae bacterium]|nr:hypothetical protein [Paracoccaceae bacterium]